MRTVEEVEGQRRAAGGTKVALRRRGALERGRLTASPGKAFNANLRQGGERAANRFLAHAAMADGGLGCLEQRIAYGAALAAAGRHRFCLVHCVTFTEKTSHRGHLRLSQELSSHILGSCRPHSTPLLN